MLYDEKSILRDAAKNALINLAKYEDRDLLDLIANEAQGWGDKQRDFLNYYQFWTQNFIAHTLKKFGGGNREL